MERRGFLALIDLDDADAEPSPALEHAEAVGDEVAVEVGRRAAEVDLRAREAVAAPAGDPEADVAAEGAVAVVGHPDVELGADDGVELAAVEDEPERLRPVVAGERHDRTEQVVAEGDVDPA